MSNKKAKIQQGTIAPVTNPEVKKAINNLKLGSTPEKQEALSNALKKARLLAPCNFDVELKPNHKGVLPTVNPTQIKFFLINTNDGKAFFPAFTDVEESTKFKVAGDKDDMPKNIVRTIQEYDVLLSDPNSKVQGVIINPGSDNIVIPKALIALLVGRVKPKSVQPTAPMNVTYSEPNVYPTRLVNAVYDYCETNDAVSRVWLKAKLYGPAMTFFLVVEAEKPEHDILIKIHDAAVPHAKDLPVEVVFINNELRKNVIKEAVAMYDRNISF